MSPAVWLVDGVSACMLYSMVECRALDVQDRMGRVTFSLHPQGVLLQVITLHLKTWRPAWTSSTVVYKPTMD